MRPIPDVAPRRLSLAAVATALAALLALLGAAGPALADPPIWHVRGAHSQITLFGSVHLLSPRTQWETPALMADLAAAQELWFEIPIDPAAQGEAAVQALKLGVLPQGESLTALLAPATEAKMLTLARTDGVQPGVLDRLRPWMAELMLSNLYFLKAGADSSLGVEMQLSKAAPAGVQRDAFETVAGQLHMFADDPVPDQIASLKQTLEEIDDDPGLFARIVDEWTRGDVRALVRDVIEPMRRDTPDLYERLLAARNRRFAARIGQMVGGSDNVVVVVGVGHLIGPDGVPALLRQAGYRVEGP